MRDPQPDDLDQRPTSTQPGGCSPPGGPRRDAQPFLRLLTEPEHRQGEGGQDDLAEDVGLSC